MNISVVIPNYNGEELLKKNLPKVFEAARYYASKDNARVEIVIVDDGSSDNSIEIVQSSRLAAKRAKFKVQSYSLKLKIIKNEKNLGFSSTVNRGVREASGEIVILLNTDVIPKTDFLVPLLSHFREEAVFAVGCLEKSEEGGKVVLRGRGVGRWEKGFLMHQRGEVDKTNTLWVSGGSGAFRKSMWEKLDGLNELYNPFYWEDIDISYRALKSGYKIIFDPKSVVVHQHEKGEIKKEYSPLQVKKISYRNQFMFVWLNVSDANLLISHILWLPYHFLKSLLAKDWAFYIGFYNAILRLRKIISYRSKNKKNFEWKDKDVTAEFLQDI